MTYKSTMNNIFIFPCVKPIQFKTIVCRIIFTKKPCRARLFVFCANVLCTFFNFEGIVKMPLQHGNVYPDYRH